MSHLIWKSNPYNFSTVYGVKSCFKILVSAVGGLKNFFNIKLYPTLVEMLSSSSSLSGHCEGGLSDTNHQEVHVELIRPK